MIKEEIKITGLFVGTPNPIEDNKISAIRKSKTNELIVSKFSLSGDQVANSKYHGGEMRVIHHYTQRNYNHLKRVFPDIADRFIPGSFGENILTEDLNEQELCVGDIFTIGSTKLQLTVPRRPCATINSSYQDKRVLKEIISSGCVGWFYRVIDEGVIKNSDILIFCERPFPNLLISKLFKQGYSIPKFSDTNFLQACLDTGLMDKGWLPKITNAL